MTARRPVRFILLAAGSVVFWAAQGCGLNPRSEDPSATTNGTANEFGDDAGVVFGAGGTASSGGGAGTGGAFTGGSGGAGSLLDSGTQPVMDAADAAADAALVDGGDSEAPG